MKVVNTENNSGSNSSKLEPFSEDNREIFNQLIKNSFDIIVLMDEDGNQTFVSNSCERILGFKPSGLINIPVIEEMIHPEDQPVVREAFIDIIKNGSHGGIQYRHLHKDGHWVYLEAFGNNLLKDPLIQSVVLNVRDVTKRKRAEKKLLENEQRLKELNATKDRFISIIGHDLKNPFNTIIGFSELLLDDVKNNDFSDVEQYARHINESSHRVDELLTNLLTWSRTQSGRIHFRPEKIELEKILADIRALLNDSARNKSISINIPKDSKNYVIADMDMLHTIIRNLISNGIKFTPQGGEISIHISTQQNQTTIAVSDTGVGISEEKLTNLFQIESAETTLGTNGEKGTGFGLLLTKEFVNQHNGEIWVEQNEGNGVTFKFTLPSA